jgi:two-component system chemotaxis sensor kinase CheA
MVLQHATGLDGERNPLLVTTMSDLARHTRAMQEAIMAIRMMPMSFVFSRFPRMVRDTATKLGKQVELVTDGDQTELDKTVIERLADPLTHLVRNAIDHGIEMPDARRQAGKSPVAQVRLSAYHKGGNVFIDVADDGAGLNHKRILAKAVERGLVTPEATPTDDEIAALIFQPGFSTADVVTDVSGRGVGMDVVRRNIHELGGSVGITTQSGQGTVFTIRLPLTLAIVDGMAIRLDDQVYIIPILNIIESLRPSPGQVKTIGRATEVLTVRGDYLPLIRLADVFGVPAASDHRDEQTGIAMIVEAEQQRAALFVDDLIGERQVVIKSLEENYRPVEGVSGATILGDGRVALILDLPGLVKRAHRASARRAFIKEDDHDHRAYADAE